LIFEYIYSKLLNDTTQYKIFTQHSNQKLYLKIFLNKHNKVNKFICILKIINTQVENKILQKIILVCEKLFNFFLTISFTVNLYV